MAAKPLWEGRLAGGMDPAFAAVNASIGFDQRLWREDLATNRAHLEALARAGLVTADEAAVLRQALDRVEAEFADGMVRFAPELEDIHMHVEARLTAHAGDVAGKIHTGRSRNDQVATDLRMYVRRQAAAVRLQLADLVAALCDRAEGALDVILPAYTHLQRAQPMVLGHWFMAYAEMGLRDAARFAFAKKQADALPLGLGACTGNPFGLDREFLRAQLGFSRLCRNALDGVSDRDFVLDFLYAAACLFLHLSRLSEDLILWSSSEFGFVELDAGLSTGSSMMPQKRNADSLELTRGKTGRVLGSLMAVMITLKGLPMAYNKDLQEDKEPLFDAADTTLAMLPVVTRVIATLRIDAPRCARALEGGFLEATAVADYLVRKGIPFRSAYKTVGGIVRDLAARQAAFRDLSIAQWRAYDAAFDDDITTAVTAQAIVAARDGVGGTAPDAVRSEIARLRGVIAGLRAGREDA